MVATAVSLNVSARPVPDAETSAVKKTFQRLIPLVMLIYVLGYIDRVNVGFAALRMNSDLGLSATMFGVANTAFFVTYVIFEVPSNMMLAKLGARIWIPRIMITWGLVSMATMFAVGPYSLYTFRALLGLAEAGLLPGILYFLSLWFPTTARARANSFFMAALPLALVIGAPLSGLIMQMDGILGLKGWQWMFLLEGLPPVLLGIAAFWLLPASISSVSWLTEEEKLALIRKLEEEDAAKGKKDQKHSIWHEVRSFRILGFGLTLFCIMTSMSVLGTWIPLIVKEILGGSERILLISFLSALPPLAAVVAILINGAHSDKTNERAWHTRGVMALGALGWLICIFAPTPTLKMAGLILTAAGVYSSTVTFWTMVSLHLSQRSRAAGIAAVAAIGTISPTLTPILVGVLRDLTSSFTVVMWYGMSALLVGIVIITLNSRPTQTSA